MSIFQRIVRKAITGLLAWLAMHGSVALAEDDFRFSGFGSVGVVHENLKDAGFTRYITQPQPENNNTSYLTDSILGLQGNYTLSPQFELVGQLVLRDQKDPTLNRSLEWAYLSWRPDAQTDVRFGRVGADSFMLSDYRHVGFAQTWVRPPTEFYGWIPLFSINGADASYRFRSGETHWQIKGQFGNSSSLIPTGPNEVYKFEADRYLNLSLRAEHGPWQFMTAITTLRVGSEAIPSTLSSGLSAIGGSPFVPSAIRKEAQQLNSGLWTDGANVRYLMLGGAYQDGPWQVQTEIAKVSSDTPVMPDGLAAYAMVSHRYGNLTPYAVVSGFRSSNAAAAAQNNWAVLGRSAAQLQTAAVAASNTYHIDQNGLALGVRWDINSRTDLKLQWDHKHIDAHGYGLWQIDNTQNGAQAQSVNIFSAVVDFTF
jgi:hypothetical protein